MNAVNIGILAHVDAGKTSLTERLLFSAGVIDQMGSVDAGNTQTDSLALEQQRGITIKSAVVSFVINNVTINLIDTPGHPDFIAEVERVLGVLDGAVLVISAVEGVQAQTRVLMRVLQRLRIPTLIFINKIDRRGAQPEHVLQSIAERLTPAILPMGTASDLGTRSAQYQPYQATDNTFTDRMVDLLADHDDSLLAAYVNGEASISYQQLHRALTEQTRQARVHPVYCGSAITGAGVDALITGITELLPTSDDDPHAPISGTVFKIERGPAKEKIAYVRIFAGTVHVRDQLRFGRNKGGRVTAIRVFERGTVLPRGAVHAGQIGKLWGLSDIQIGDTIGSAQTAGERHFFAPPTLETIIVPQRQADRGALHAALAQLTEQDPLINLRQDELQQELFLSLYGEVQKEVIQATLLNDFHVAVEFRETTMICIERPIGVGAEIELLGADSNPFLATIGFRIEPGPINSGVTVRLEAKVDTIPIYVYKAIEHFQEAIADTVEETLSQGLYGWQVTDCIVTITTSDYSSPATTARDFRLLTPLVLMSALQQAGTIVCEPMHHFHLEIPADAYGPMMPILARLRAIPQTSALTGAAYVVEGEIPAAQVHELYQQLPALSRGEGVLECSFERYKPIRGTPPIRQRSDNNPLNRKEYLLHVIRRV